MTQQTAVTRITLFLNGNDITCFPSGIRFCVHYFAEIFYIMIALELDSFDIILLKNEERFPFSIQETNYGLLSILVFIKFSLFNCSFCLVKGVNNS